jgi:hypothetical protein
MIQEPFTYKAQDLLVCIEGMNCEMLLATHNPKCNNAYIIVNTVEFQDLSRNGTL